MLRNYLTIAGRDLKKHKSHALINGFGLALGLAACLLIALYVRHELSYDDFHEKADRIQQVIVRSSGGSIDRIAKTPRPLASAMQGQFSQIERLVRLKERTSVVRQGTSSQTEDVLYADSGFFQTFSFPLIQGEPGDVLSSPSGVVLTAEKARQLFGTTDAVGRPLRVRLEGTFYDVTVTGVAEAPPSSSSIQFGVVAPFRKYEQVAWTSRNTNWGSLDPLLYVELQRPHQVEALAAQLSDFIEETVPQNWAKNVSLELLPLPETHLTPGIYGQLEPTSRPLYAYILGGIAALILLIAGVNFVTLSLSRAVGRAREVGVRKTVGAGRGQLMAQFWGEAFLLCGAALLLGMLVLWRALPVFNRLVGKELTVGMLLQPDMLGVLVGLLAVVGLAAGAYPAMALSRFDPAPILRGRLPGGGSSRLVQGLVVGQFVLAIGLIVGVGVMWQQMELLRSKDLGFQQEHVVQVDARSAEPKRVQVLRERFRRAAQSAPSIQHVTALWGELAVEGALPNRLATESGGAKIKAHLLRGHYDLVQTLGLTLNRGRSFSPEYGRDAEGKTVLVNEALVEAFGWEEPLGKTLSVQFAVPKATVVGVVEDFHFQTLHRPIEPLVMTMASRVSPNQIYARIAPGQTTDALDRLRAVWNETVPTLPLSASFLDETVEQQYRADARWTRLVTWAAGFGVFIACMGLFGLATLAVRRRTKEVGIRKALGASAASIVRLLSIDFLKLVLLAFVLAAPLAYWAAEQWLQSFAYRVEVGAAVFGAAGGLTLAVALLAVGGQTLRAARLDPATTLRDE